MNRIIFVGRRAFGVVLPRPLAKKNKRLTDALNYNFHGVPVPKGRAYHPAGRHSPDQRPWGARRPS